MKYLFIVQGEGRGHLTQAISLYEMLTKNGNEVVGVLVGKSESMTLPAFFQEKVPCPISYFISPHFVFSSDNKKTLFFKSIFYNLKKTFVYLKNIRFLREKINESGADVVVSFYEVLTGFTYAFSRPKVPYICIAHQYLLLHPDFIFPKKSKIELAGLKFLTRLSCMRASRLLALSFTEMRDVKKLHVVPPLLRKEVLQKTPTKGDYILGYMVNAGFSEEIIKWHEAHKDVSLHCFWNNKEAPKELVINENLSFHQLNDTLFLDYMAGCKAYASTGGFESICEAMYLQKPVMMVPAHIEQECNALDAMNAGAGIASPEFNLTTLLDYLPNYKPNTAFAGWVHKVETIFLDLLKG